MRPLVSVVIPAHNPGRYIEPCIRSLGRQTFARDQFEVVFVDDGSTDGTGARLDRLAMEERNVRVIHIAASGAPGRPRNIGLEAALGEYVQFLDADDELAPNALARLYRMARANRSDIVIGKFASQTMDRRQDVFTRNRRSTTLAATPQLASASLGPTKLFRAAFLRDHELAFPEGWRQMEDQLFTLRAYLAAEVVSILGDEPCYFFNRREDEGHISSERVDPRAHSAHLREIAEEVERRVADPGLRTRLLGRFYRTEVLARLTGPQYVEAPSAHRAALYEALRRLLPHFGPEVDGTLGTLNRIRSRLLRAGDAEGLLALARRAGAFAVQARISSATWERGRLTIRYRAMLSRGIDAHPLLVDRRDGRTLLDPAVASDLVGEVDVTDELAGTRAQVSLVQRSTALEWIVPGSTTLALRPLGAGEPRADRGLRVPTLLGRVEVDPQRVGPGERPLEDGAWDLHVRWIGLGLLTAGPLRFSRRARSASAPVAPALLGQPVRWAVPIAGEHGELRLLVGGPGRAPARLDEGARRVTRDGGGLAVFLPVATERAGPLASGVVRLRGDAGTFELPAVFFGSVGGLMVSVRRIATGGVLPRGRYELTAHVGGGRATGVALGTGHVRDDGRLVVVGIDRETGLARLRTWGEWTARHTAADVMTRASAAYGGLPAPARGVLRLFRGRSRA